MLHVQSKKRVLQAALDLSLALLHPGLPKPLLHPYKPWNPCELNPFAAN